MSAIEDARAALVRLDEYKRTLSGRVTADDLADQLRALIAEHERLTIPPTDDEREALVERFDMLRNSGVCAPTTRGLLDDAEVLLRRQGPITDATVEAAVTAWEARGGPKNMESMLRAALEAAERAR